MAYYKVRIEVWCDWNPAESDLDDITQAMGVGEAICTMREIFAVVDRPKDIEDEEAMIFFGGSEGDADESQGKRFRTFPYVRVAAWGRPLASRPDERADLLFRPRGE